MDLNIDNVTNENKTMSCVESKNQSSEKTTNARVSFRHCTFLLRIFKSFLMFSKETLQQYRRRRKDKIINASENKRKSQPRGPSLIITSSVLSMFSVSKLSLASDYEEEINCTKQLTVLKILIGDILLSLIDPITDFIQVRDKQ